MSLADKFTTGDVDYAEGNSTIIDPDTRITTNVTNADSRSRSVDDFFHVAKPMCRKANPNEARLVGCQGVPSKPNQYLAPAMDLFMQDSARYV
jgi:hypothetical protein